MILVFGGTGFVGSFVSSYLSRHYKVLLAVRNPEKAKKLGLNYSRFSSVEEIPALIEEVNPDVIVNFIGALKGDYWLAHVRIPELIAEGAKNTGSRVIHTSALGADENSRIPYFRTKAIGEREIKGLKHHAITRPSLILGPGQRLFQMVKFVFPDLKSRIQPIDLRDLTRAYGLIIEENLEGTFNLCGVETIELGKLVKAVFKMAGKWVILLPTPSFLLRVLGRIEPAVLMSLTDNLCVKNDATELLGNLTSLNDSIRWTAEGLR